MIKLGIYNYYSEYNNNQMFNPNFASSIGDDLTYSTRLLFEEGIKRDIHVSTIDTQPLEEYDVIIFLDFPTYNNPFFTQLIRMKFQNIILIINENELIRPDNWNRDNYRHFRRVYTWNDKIVDNKMIFKFFLPNKIPDQIPAVISEKNKFCCMIAGNKSSHHALELYSERIRAIRWFETHEPHAFDLYGQGWLDHTFKGLLRPLNLSKALKRICTPEYLSYRGPIISKHDILKEYKFSICYENARDIPGYISEKIFDCFFAGCIPVYLGAPNISEFIPEGTFIDKRNFATYQELFFYLNNMSVYDYDRYLKSIIQYIKSEKIFPFSAEYFTTLILDEIAMISIKT